MPPPRSNPTTDNLADAVHDATAGRGVQFAFDAAGTADLLRTGFDVTSIGGTVVSVGAAFGERLLELWKAGRLPLDQLVSNRRPIEQINAGFDDMTAGRELCTVATF